MIFFNLTKMNTLMPGMLQDFLKVLHNSLMYFFTLYCSISIGEFNRFRNKAGILLLRSAASGATITCFLTPLVEDQTGACEAGSV